MCLNADGKNQVEKKKLIVHERKEILEANVREFWSTVKHRYNFLCHSKEGRRGGDRSQCCYIYR